MSSQSHSSRSAIQSVGIGFLNGVYRMTIDCGNPVRPSDGSGMIFNQIVCFEVVQAVDMVLGSICRIVQTYTKIGPLTVYHVWELTEGRQLVEDALYAIAENCKGCDVQHAADKQVAQTIIKTDNGLVH